MDIQLRYFECGSGEPLVLLHGNGEDSTYFEHQIAFFEDSYRVIAVDSRGHGRSTRGTAPLTLGQLAKDLGAFMDGMGIGSAHILGFSDGANVALLFALEHRECVRSLVLNGGNLFPEGLTEQTRREIDEEFERAVAANDEVQIELLRLMIDEPHIDTGQLAELDMPVLVVAGTDDMVDEAHTRLIAGSIPGAQLAFVEGTHFVASENPDAFNRVVGSFLDGCRAGAYTGFSPATCKPPSGSMGAESDRTARMRKLGRRIALGVETDEAQAARTLKRVEDTLAFLRQHQLPGRDDRVLDIGCGAGRFASALAECAGRVTGIDLAPEALAAAERHVRSLGLANVDFLPYDFLELNPGQPDWAGGFDLVFAGLVPRCMREDFVGKMEALSRGYCFMQALISLSDEPGDTLRQELLGLPLAMARSRLSRFERMVDGLRRDGRNPVVHLHHEDSEIPVTDVKKFAEEMLDNCLADRISSCERGEFVRLVCERAEEEGGLVRRIKRDSGWLLWDVRDKA